MYLKYVSTVTVTRQSNMTKGGAETYLLKARSDFLLNSLQSTLREAGKERKKYLYNIASTNWDFFSPGCMAAEYHRPDYLAGYE